jgi:anti-sigma regulatory factor (Ser/Thr protein kinase)
VIDQGGKLPPLPGGATPDIEEKLEDDVPRGLGLFLIEQLVDGVEMQAGDGRTEFTMWFDIKRTPASETASLSVEETPA